MPSNGSPPDGNWITNAPRSISFRLPAGTNYLLLRNPMPTMRGGELAVPARQIKLTSDESIAADVRPCLTVASLYTLVGLGMVVAM